MVAELRAERKRKPGKQPGAPGAAMRWRKADEVVGHFPPGDCACDADLADAADRGVARGLETMREAGILPSFAGMGELRRAPGLRCPFDQGFSRTAPRPTRRGGARAGHPVVARPQQKPGREMLEFCRDRQADVLRFATDTRVWPTNNLSERGVRPLKTPITTRSNPRHHHSPSTGVNADRAAGLRWPPLLVRKCPEVRRASKTPRNTRSRPQRSQHDLSTWYCRIGRHPELPQNNAEMVYTGNRVRLVWNAGPAPGVHHISAVSSATTGELSWA
jgi:Transposase IS66 family